MTGDEAVDDAIKRQGLRDQVHARLLRMLMETELRPGMHLGIDSLARQFGVSPTPVREAMVLLERTGLVEREPLRGYRIAEPLSEAEMTELMQARELLEVHVTSLAADRASQFVAELERVHTRHAELIAAVLADPAGSGTADYRRCFEADGAFHRVIAEHCGNRFIVGMLDSLTAHVHRLRQEVLNESYDFKEALTEHRAILDCYLAGRPQDAVQAMRDHMNGVRARVAG